MAQVTTGIRSILSRSKVYEHFQAFYNERGVLRLPYTHIIMECQQQEQQGR